VLSGGRVVDRTVEVGGIDWGDGKCL